MFRWTLKGVQTTHYWVVQTTHSLSFYSGPSAREIPPRSSFAHMSEQYNCNCEKGTTETTGYSSLLCCFGGCRNGVTTRSCLSRRPGIQVAQHLWSLAPCFLSGLRSCHCALTPISPQRWCLSLLRHSICSLSSLWVGWKEDFPPLTWCYSQPGSLQMGYGYPDIIYHIWFMEMHRSIFFRKRYIAFHKFSKG